VDRADEFMQATLEGLSDHRRNLAGIEIKRDLDHDRLAELRKDLDTRRRKLALHIKEGSLSPVQKRDIDRIIQDLEDEEIDLSWLEENAGTLRKKFSGYGLGSPTAPFELPRR
jgi:hypothetical protein